MINDSIYREIGKGGEAGLDFAMEPIERIPLTFVGEAPSLSLHSHSHFLIESACESTQRCEQEDRRSVPLALLLFRGTQTLAMKLRRSLRLPFPGGVRSQVDAGHGSLPHVVVSTVNPFAAD